MSWLSQGIADVGNVWNQDVKPALSNPWVDAGLLAGGALLTGGLLAPEALGLGGVFGGADAAGAAAGAGAGAAAGGAGAADLTAGAAGLGDWLAPGATDFGSTLGGLGGQAATDTTNLFADASGSSLLNPGPTTSVLNAGGGAGGGATASADAAGGGSLANVDPNTWSLQGYAGVNPDIAAQAMTPQQPPGFFGGLQESLSPSNLGTGLGKAASNPATLLGVGGLGYNLYQGYQQKQQLNQLQQQEQANAASVAQNAKTAQAAAGPALSQGQILTEYLTTGTLPQALQSQVDQQVAATKAQVIQGYGARGMSTNPQQNSALAQDLANVDAQKESLMGTLQTNLAQAGQQMIQTATNLLNSGTSATQISAQIPIMMQNLDIQLSKLTSESISSFAAALNGGARPGTGQTFTLQAAQPTQQAA